MAESSFPNKSRETDNEREFDAPILSLVQKGTDQFPRYVITKGDAIRNPVYWGDVNEQWQADEAKATVFSDVNRILWVHHSLMMESLKGKPRHQYIVPMRLELYGEKPDIEQFREWLEKAIRIVVNSPDYGYGTDGAVGVVFADFSKTRERK